MEDFMAVVVVEPEGLLEPMMLATGVLEATASWSSSATSPVPA
jgi:hypothetical protein